MNRKNKQRFNTEMRTYLFVSGFDLCFLKSHETPQGQCVRQVAVLLCLKQRITQLISMHGTVKFIENKIRILHLLLLCPAKALGNRRENLFVYFALNIALVSRTGGRYKGCNMAIHNFPILKKAKELRSLISKV